MQEDGSKAIELNPSEMLLPEAVPAIDEPKVEPVFGIRIGSIGLLVSSSRFCEVLDKTQVNPLPNVHPWVSGILNLRGNLVPVFDLRLILEEAGDNKRRRLFAVDRGEKAVALWIDNFPEIKNRLLMKPLKKKLKLPEIIQSFVINSYELEGQIWLDIKFEDLFKALGRHQYAVEGAAAT